MTIHDNVVDEIKRCFVLVSNQFRALWRNIIKRNIFAVRIESVLLRKNPKRFNWFRGVLWYSVALVFLWLRNPLTVKLDEGVSSSILPNVTTTNSYANEFHNYLTHGLDILATFRDLIQEFVRADSTTLIKRLQFVSKCSTISDVNTFFLTECFF